MLLVSSASTRSVEVAADCDQLMARRARLRGPSIRLERQQSNVGARLSPVSSVSSFGGSFARLPKPLPDDMMLPQRAPVPAASSDVCDLFPLCPALVLPRHDAVFAVSIAKLAQPCGTFDINGLSGSPLLRAGIQPTGAGTSLHVSMTPRRSPILASVLKPPSAVGLPPNTLEVRGASLRSYGQLHRHHLDQPWLLTCADREVLQVQGHWPHGELQGAPELAGKWIQVIASHNAKAMAFAQLCDSKDLQFISRHGEQWLEIRVLAGVDAVLAILCIMAVVAFGGQRATSGGDEL